MYLTPTPADFKARHPRFAAVADATVAAVLDEAARSASQGWSEGDFRDAILNLAAHILIEEGATGDQAGSVSNTAGAIQKIEAGDTKVTFDVAASRFTDNIGATYGNTAYGRRFADIVRRNTAGAVLVV